MTASFARRALLERLGDVECVDLVLNALDQAGFQVVAKSDALEAARCVNVAATLGTSDPTGLAQRLEPDW